MKAPPPRRVAPRSRVDHMLAFVLQLLGDCARKPLFVVTLNSYGQQETTFCGSDFVLHLRSGRGLKTINNYKACTS